VDPSVLSPVAQDYLKVIWTRTEWGAPPITTGELASRFGTSAANVSETVRRLAAQDLLEYVPYKPVKLTALGTSCALAMVRRHRLVETYLVRELGYTWDEVHDEAELLEHAVTERFITRIDAILGHPDADPHGDPIPDPDGRLHRPMGARPLGDVTAAGAYRVVRVSDADVDVLREAGERDWRPGALLQVVPEEVPPALAGAVLVVPARGQGSRSEGDRADGQDVAPSRE
jgi:DtxR family Mn-dependent transcriptional regulator